MVAIQTQDLIGAALDWAVAKCENADTSIEHFIAMHSHYTYDHGTFDYSTNWSQGGPILQNHIGALEDFVDEGWTACCMGHSVDGNTPLEAVCRAYVTAKLGETVEIPDELIDDEPQPCPTCGEYGGTSCGAIDCDH